MARRGLNQLDVLQVDNISDDTRFKINEVKYEFKMFSSLRGRAMLTSISTNLTCLHQVQTQKKNNQAKRHVTVPQVAKHFHKTLNMGH